MVRLQSKTSCPKCGGRITIGTALLATPYRFTCPRCRSKLKMVIPGLWLWLAGAVILGLLLGAGLLFVLTLRNNLYVIVYLVTSLVLAVLAEILTAMIFFTKGEVRTKEK